MKLIKLSAVALMLSFGVFGMQAEDVRVKGGSYIGDVGISLGGDPMMVENQTIIITATGNGTCDFALNNFSLDGSEDGNLGNIFVPNVKTTKTPGSDVINIAGGIDDLKLGPEGIPEESMIHANVTVEGTENANRELDMQIHVLWLMDPTDPTTGMPIEVTFKGKWDGHSGINSVVGDDTDVAPRYYQIDGSEVKDATASGLYIVRRGNTTSKVVVK